VPREEAAYQSQTLIQVLLDQSVNPSRVSKGTQQQAEQLSIFSIHSPFSAGGKGFRIPQELIPFLRPMSNYNQLPSDFGSLALGHSGSSSGEEEGGSVMPAVTRSQTSARQAGASSAAAATMSAGRSMAARRGTAAMPAAPPSTVRRAPTAQIRYAQAAGRADSSDEDDDDDDDEDEYSRRARDVLAYFEPDKLFVNEAFDANITQRSHERCVTYAPLSLKQAEKKADFPYSATFARLGHALTSNVQSAASLAAIEASFPNWHLWAISRVKQTITNEMKKYHDKSIDIVTSVGLLVRVIRECTYLLKYHSATTSEEMTGAIIQVMWFIVSGDQHVSPNPGYVGGAHEHNLYRRFVSQPAAWVPVLRWWGQTLEDGDVLEAFRNHVTYLRNMWVMVNTRHQQATPEDNEYRFKAEFGVLIQRILGMSRGARSY
jgi:hypothetical protein